MVVPWPTSLPPLCSNPINKAILTRLPMLGVADAWLVAGSLYQSYWNSFSGRPITDGIKDYDIFYFDPSDLSYEAEDAVPPRSTGARRSRRPHRHQEPGAGPPLVQGPLRQRLPCPYLVARESIGRFQVRCTCVGLQPQADGSLELHAPYGTGGTHLRCRLRLNSNCPDQRGIRAKAESYRARWPWLTIEKIS